MSWRKKNTQPQVLDTMSQYLKQYHNIILIEADKKYFFFLLLHEVQIEAFSDGVSGSYRCLCGATLGTSQWYEIDPTYPALYLLDIKRMVRFV
jgi:hypothetical protein